MKKRNVYWFFRAFTFAAIIIFCIMFFVLGSAYAYTKMHKVITGEEINISQSLKNLIGLLMLWL